ncbi:MAG: helix-turn-helix transcriptional regulator [Candidatus Pacebacteria bacterium]|nr:helix-turn-helix transcriptional regulator [Candidatus Paceibacterota bacterium]
MRLPTETELIVIRLLLNGLETYAYDLVKLADGQLAKNGIYVILLRMTARKLISDRMEQKVRRPGPRRRLYKLTDFGRQVYKAHEAAYKILKDAKVKE